MRPEEFEREENRLQSVYKEKLNVIRKRYNIPKNLDLQGDNEPNESPEIFDARKECKNCKKEYFENRDKIKKELIDTFNNQEIKIKELEEKLEKSKKKEDDLYVSDLFF